MELMWKHTTTKIMITIKSLEQNGKATSNLLNPIIKFLLLPENTLRCFQITVLNSQRLLKNFFQH
jgi:hypothetical protein